jgi:multiple sugar transport system substrate-binding protein
MRLLGAWADCTSPQKTKIPMKRLFLSVMLVLALAGCSLFPAAGPAATPGLPAATTSPAPELTPSLPEDESTPAGPLELPRTAPALSLTVWVPPEFDPTGSSPASVLLRDRIRAFEIENGLHVQVRVKDVQGPGGLMEALSAAGAAAPLAMPSLIALPRPFLEEAALKGLIVPLDGLSNLINQPDWYTYARQLASVQGATFALPFAGDALVMVYRPSAVVEPPNSWQAAMGLAQPLAFPAGDPQALLPLTLYRSNGGEIEDAQRRPFLAVEELTPVLQLLVEGEGRGLFPFWLSQYETYDEVWKVYIEMRANAAVVWSSSYLSNLPVDTNVLPLPPMASAVGVTNGANGPAGMTLATGWGWAVADSVPERRQAATRLAEFLTAGDFLAQWTEAAGYLPTRPSALAGWSNGAAQAVFSPVALSAQARPTTDLLLSQGTVLKEAVLKVLKREATASEAANAAAQRLTAPQAR